MEIIDTTMTALYYYAKIIISSNVLHECSLAVSIIVLPGEFHCSYWLDTFIIAILLFYTTFDICLAS